MARLRPGWLVALAAAGLSVSAWLPWLTSPVGGGGVHRAVAGLGRADPALFALRGNDVDLVTGGLQGPHEFMQEHAVDAVVVRDQKAHPNRRAGRAR